MNRALGHFETLGQLAKHLLFQGYAFTFAGLESLLNRSLLQRKSNFILDGGAAATAILRSWTAATADRNKPPRFMLVALIPQTSGFLKDGAGVLIGHVGKRIEHIGELHDHVVICPPVAQAFPQLVGRRPGVFGPQRIERHVQTLQAADLVFGHGATSPATCAPQASRALRLSSR